MNAYTDPELEYRRTLMQAAAVGDAEAQRTLWREYRVRIYSGRHQPVTPEGDQHEASRQP